MPLAAASAAAIGPRTPVLPCTTCVPPRSLSGGERACWGPPQHAHKSLEKKEQGLGPPKIYWRFDRNPCRSLKTLGNRRTRLYFDVVQRYSKKVVVPVTRPIIHKHAAANGNHVLYETKCYASLKTYDALGHGSAKKGGAATTAK